MSNSDSTIDTGCDQHNMLHCTQCEDLQTVKRLYDRLDAMPRRPFPHVDGTRDPIYLLQSRRWHCRNVDDYTYGDDECLRDLDGVEVDEEYKRGHSDDWEESWYTEGVWFTRKEVEDFAKATHYRYTHGYRTYCVCANGELAKLLKLQTDREDGLVG